MTMSRVQLNRLILGILSLIFISIFPLKNSFSISVIVIITTINAFFCILKSLKNNHYLNFIFIVLLLEVLLGVFFTNYLIDIKETSWRLNYNVQDINFISVKLLCISIIIFVLIYNTTLYGKLSKKELNFHVNESFFNLLCLVILIFLPFFVNKSGFMTVRNYEITNNISSPLMGVYRILQILFFVLASLIIHNANKSLQVLRCIVCIGFVSIDLLMCIFGYRFIFVELLFLLLFIKLYKIKTIKKKTLLLLLFVVVFIYLMFTIISITRESGLEEVNLQTIFNNLFKHERNEFYTLNAIIRNRPQIRTINTYYNTFINILPGIVTRASKENTGRLLLQYINLSAYKNSEITYGGFYLAEAYFNYGYKGAIIINIIVGFVLCFLETHKRTLMGILIYFLFISQSYSILFYGSSNYFKFILYFLVLVYLLFLTKLLEN